MFRFFIALAFFSGVCFAQQIATLPDGKKIQVFENGSWKPYSDSIKSSKIVPDSVNTIAQFDSSCSALIETVTDKMSGRSYVVAKQRIIASENKDKALVISLMSGSEGDVTLTIKVFGAGHCIDEGDKIQILFTDNSRMALVAYGKYNCDAKATVYFGGIFGKRAELNELGTKKISAVRVWTNDSHVEVNFSKENANAFYYTVRCLIKLIQ